MLNEAKRTSRERRTVRTRGKLINRDCPRLSVFRSRKYLYVQIIDDTKGQTLLAVNSYHEVKSDDKKILKIDQAKAIGEQLAKEALKKGIKKVVFDRGSYRFHGLVKALADGARAGGLNF